MIREDMTTRAATRLKTRARCYIRVSRVGNRELLSDESQLSGARKLCAEMGWTLDEAASRAHMDLDQSGYSKGWSKRKGLRKHVEDAKSGLYDYLIVYRLDRLGRNLFDGLECFKILDKYGVEVRTLEGKMDPNDPTGLFLIQNMLNVAQLEASNSSARARTIVAYRAETGRWHGGNLPTWLMHDPESPKVKGQRRPVVAHEPTQAAVLRMVELRLEGYGMGEITKTLNAEGYEPQRGGSWHYSIVRRYFRPDYIDSMLGHAYIHRPERRRKNALTGKTEAYEDGPQKVPNIWPAIIDQDTADRLKAIHAQTRKPHTAEVAAKTRERGSDFILTGSFHCAECGERMSTYRYPAKRVRDTRAYKCYSAVGKLGLGVDHTRTNVSAGVAEDAVLRVVRHVLERLPQVERKRKGPRRAAPAARTVEQITGDIDRLMGLLERGVLAESDFERRYGVLVAERERLQTQEEAPQIDIDTALALVEKEELTPANLRMIVRSLCERVEYPVYLPGVETTCNRKGGTDRNPRPCVRVTLRYVLNGVNTFVAPIYMGNSKAERLVVPVFPGAEVTSCA